MIIDNTLAAVKNDGVIELKTTGSDGEIKGQTILAQKSFKANGAVIPESETPFGRYGMRLEITVLKGKPAADFAPEAVAGSGNIKFEVYDGDPATSAEPDNLVATYGPFTAEDMNALDKSKLEPLVDAVIPAKTKGKILLKSVTSTTKGAAFTGGYLFARWVPNI